MQQRLITIAIDYSEEDEQAIAEVLAAKFGGSASTLKEAIDVVVTNLQTIDRASIPHWSCSITQNWITQQEEITRLYQALDQHQYDCCHQVAEPPVGAVDFVRAECPPAHNCQVCANILV